MPADSDDVFDVRDLTAALRRQWRVAGLVLLAVVVLGAVYTAAQPPTYAADVQIAVEPPSQATEVERLLFGAAEAQTQAAIAGSSLVATRALEAVGRPATPSDTEAFVRGRLETRTRPDTTILVVTVQDGRPAEAARTAQAVADAYVEVSGEQASARLARADEALDAEAGRIRAELAGVQDQLTGDAGSTRSSLELERDELQADLRALSTRRAELASAAALSQRPTIVQPAVEPDSPVRPKPLVNGALSVVLGLVLAAAVAIVREQLRAERRRQGADGTAA